MKAMRWSVVGLAMTASIAGPAVAQPEGELGELDYWCLPECMAVGFHDRGSDTETILFNGRIEMNPSGSGSPSESSTVEIGEMWLRDGQLDVELGAFCYSDSGPGPVDGVVTVELGHTNDLLAPHAVTVDFAADAQADPREHQSTATEASIALGPSEAWGASWYRVSVTANSDSAEWCAYEGRMVSTPAVASA